jgi:hypothetical protein
LGEDFLLLALRIDKHIKGYVDFYIGPEKFKLKVNNESIHSPKKLLNDCNNLQNKLFKQGYEKNRVRYLEKSLIAMRTSIEDLLGIKIPFKEKFLRLYDVELQPINESKLDKLTEDFNMVYKGNGNLDERMKVIRERRRVKEEDVYSFFKKGIAIVKMKTNELFGDILPKEEKILIELINDSNIKETKWAYYEWYLGNYLSRIEVNPKFNNYWSSLLSAAAHEGYPGHHTHFVINEKRLFNELHQFEHSILLLNSPKLVICEGIANLAIDVLFTYSEQAEMSLKFCKDYKQISSVDDLAKENELKSQQSIYWYNLAYHALISKWNEKELNYYASNFQLGSQKTIENMLKLIFNPAHSTTAFLYNLGSNLIKKKYGGIPSVTNFQDLLEKPVLPSDLV